MNLHWHQLTPPDTVVRQLQTELGCSPLFARILANRNLDHPDKVRRFLSPSLTQLREPFGLKDMAPAVERIAGALLNNEKFMVFGDYDVDGVTAASVLSLFLEQAGARLCTYIPDRIEEGYGLRASQIDNCVIPRNIDLLITVDCGSASGAAVSRAAAAGIDVIVTDHHSVGQPPTDALAFVNPKRTDCRAGFEHLAGVGVVFVLLICLRKHLREIGYWRSRSEPNLKYFCDLVALGSIADSVPLIADNRIFTRTGLQMMQQGNLRVGLDQLFKKAGIEAGRVTEEDIAYKVAPRLNAAGRMDHAVRALKLLSCRDLQEARRLADALDWLNSRRRDMEAEVLQQIQRQLKDHPDMLQKSSLVLAHDDWHEGVIGIVAARLTERYHKPATVISIRDGVGKGSARSVAGIDLYRILQHCADPLDAFGGHAMAAGLRIKEENIAAFQNLFEHSVRGDTTNRPTRPEIKIDARLDLNQISDRLISDIQQLRPFGPDNDEPILMAEQVKVVRSRIVGQRHLKLRLAQAAKGTGKTFEAIRFNVDPDRPAPVDIQAMAFRLQWNYWNGKKTVQLVVEDMR